jgi:hypothetical protein
MTETKQIVAEFAHVRTGKNSYRYDETGEILKIGAIYVQKYVLGAPPPARITVTIEVA